MNFKILTSAWLILILIFYIASLFAWFGISLLALLAFDNGVNISALLFVALIWSYPILIALIEWFSWRFYFKSKYLQSIIIATFPLIIIILIYWILFGK